MNNVQRKEFIDMKLNKLINAIRENRKCKNKSWSENLEDENIKLSSKYSSNYEHRFLAQKEIIKCQKGTINTQEKIIEEMQNELKQQKLAELKVDVKKVDKRPATAKLPDVLQGMKLRQEERRKRWAILKEQKALKEKQRLDEATQREIETKKQIAEQKRQKFKEVARRMREIEEQKIHDKLIKDAAIKFSNRFTIMIHFAVWWIESRETKARLLTAKYAVNKYLMSVVLRNWRISVQLVINLRQNAAEKFYRRTIMKRYILFWQNYCQQMKFYDESMIRIYDKELMASAFRRWHIYCLKSQIDQEEKFQSAKTIYSRSMHKHYFKMWMNVPKLNYEKREQEKRIRNWQSSVQQVIPDFQIQE